MMRHPTNETRAKLSVAKMGNKCALGHHYEASAEARAKLSAAHMGHVESDATRAKISVAHIGKPGHPVSPEARAKNGVAHWKGGPRVFNAKSAAKRRLLGFVSLNEPFDGCEGHHVDSQQVINMPHKLHRSIYHRQTDGRGMTQINALAYEWLAQQVKA